MNIVVKIIGEREREDYIIDTLKGVIYGALKGYLQLKGEIQDKSR